jgi:hypothetical protein
MRFLTVSTVLLGFAYGCSEPQCSSTEVLVGNVCRKVKAPVDDASVDTSLKDAGGSDPGFTASKPKLDGGRDSQPPEPFDGGDRSDAELGPPELACTVEGELRCSASGTTARQRCEQGKWVTAEACSSSTTCDETSQPAGGCRELRASCAGNAGNSVCEDNLLVVCDDSGGGEDSELCATASHCQRGLTAQKCAKCLPGQHQCAAAQLQVCAEDGSGYVAKEDCASAALCNASAGKCGMGCNAGSAVCVGDTLQRCKADLTAFETVATCESGFCDQAGKQCDVCTPASKSCSGNSVQTCDAQGQGYATQPCTAPRGICTGLGVCVECTASAACPTPSDPCYTSTCDVAAGTCRSVVNVHAPCATGVCSSTGSCVGCIDSSDCKAPGLPICNSGSCVECTSNSHCDASNHEICQDRRCVIGPYCGDGKVDSGEECDWKAPGWDPFICNDRCLQRKFYNSCGSSRDCTPGYTCAESYCTNECQSDSACPAPPIVTGLSTYCADTCQLRGCRANTDCPPGLICGLATDGAYYCSGCIHSSQCPSGQECYGEEGTDSVTGRCR